MSNLESYQSDFVLLVEAGFVAVSYLDEESATKLFHAAQVLKPTHTAPRLGLAAIALHKLDVARSCQLLEGILAEEPDNHRAGALLGISYLLANKQMEKGEKLLQEAMTAGDDPATKRLGELWLEVLEKGVRKSDSILVATPPKSDKGAKKVQKKSAEKKQPGQR